ncbi:hypothetical protein JHK82_043866 [Glycine max]|nr:hypothetical protein JHK82_043866 [Glycine max]
MARKVAGEEPLSEEDPSNPIFKPLPEPSRLESFLITNQISNYCNQSIGNEVGVSIMGRTERHGRSFNWEHGWKGASRVWGNQSRSNDDRLLESVIRMDLALLTSEDIKAKETRDEELNQE